MQCIIRHLGRVFKANDWRCMIQCVVITLGFFCFTNVASPERDPNIAGAPSVQRATSLSHIRLFFSKYFDIEFITSIPFDVVSSSCEISISYLFMLSSSKNRINTSSWQQFEMSVDSSHYKAKNDDFLILETSSSSTSFDISSIRALTVLFDRGTSCIFLLASNPKTSGFDQTRFHECFTDCVRFFRLCD